MTDNKSSLEGVTGIDLGAREVLDVIRKVWPGPFAPRRWTTDPPGLVLPLSAVDTIDRALYPMEETGA